MKTDASITEVAKVVMDAIKFPKPEKKPKKQPKPLARRTPLRAKKKYQYKPKKKEPTASVLQADRSYCFLCGSRDKGGLDGLEEHHIFEGNGKRPVSERHGLKVYLCGCTCHREGKNSAHKNIEVRRKLQRFAQRKFEETHSREFFISEFGKSYLED